MTIFYFEKLKKKSLKFYVVTVMFGTVYKIKAKYITLNDRTLSEKIAIFKLTHDSIQKTDKFDRYQ